MWQGLWTQEAGVQQGWQGSCTRKRSGAGRMCQVQWGNDLVLRQRGFREGPASQAEASPLLGFERKTLIPNCLFLRFPSKRWVLWKYHLIQCESLENMIGKVKKHTATHDREMGSPTQLALPMEVRNTMVGYCFQWRGHSDLKQSRSSPFAHFSLLIQSLRAWTAHRNTQHPH